VCVKNVTSDWSVWRRASEELKSWEHRWAFSVYLLEE
jgi:hypothetical protein